MSKSLNKSEYRRIEFGEMYDDDNKEEKAWHNYLETYYNIYKTSAKDRFKSSGFQHKDLDATDSCLPGKINVIFLNNH